MTAPKADRSVRVLLVNGVGAAKHIRAEARPPRVVIVSLNLLRFAKFPVEISARTVNPGGTA